jgi:hypothetical protein
LPHAPQNIPEGDDGAGTIGGGVGKTGTAGSSSFVGVDAPAEALVVLVFTTAPHDLQNWSSGSVGFPHDPQNDILTSMNSGIESTGSSLARRFRCGTYPYSWRNATPLSVLKFADNVLDWRFRFLRSLAGSERIQEAKWRTAICAHLSNGCKLKGN